MSTTLWPSWGPDKISFLHFIMRETDWDSDGITSKTEQDPSLTPVGAKGFLLNQSHRTAQGSLQQGPTGPSCCPGRFRMLSLPQSLVHSFWCLWDEEVKGTKCAGPSKVGFVQNWSSIAARLEVFGAEFPDNNWSVLWRLSSSGNPSLLDWSWFWWTIHYWALTTLPTSLAGVSWSPLNECLKETPLQISREQTGGLPTGWSRLTKEGEP